MRVFTVSHEIGIWIFPAEGPAHAQVIVAAALEKDGYTIERPDLVLHVHEITREDTERQMRKFGHGAFDGPTANRLPA